MYLVIWFYVHISALIPPDWLVEYQIITVLRTEIMRVVLHCCFYVMARYGNRRRYDVFNVDVTKDVKSRILRIVWIHNDIL